MRDEEISQWSDHVCKGTFHLSCDRMISHVIAVLLTCARNKDPNYIIAVVNVLEEISFQLWQWHCGSSHGC